MALQHSFNFERQTRQSAPIRKLGPITRLANDEDNRLSEKTQDVLGHFTTVDAKAVVSDEETARTKRVIVTGAVAMAATAAAGLGLGMLKSEGQDFNGPGRQETPVTSVPADIQRPLNEDPASVIITPRTEA